MGSPFAGEFSRDDAAPAPQWGNSLDLDHQALQVEPPVHWQQPHQVQPSAFHAGLHPVVYGNNNSTEMANILGFGQSTSVDLNQLFESHTGHSPFGVDVQQHDIGIGRAPPPPMFAPLSAAAPAYQLLDLDGKRNRSSGLTNMMVVPDGKAQRLKSGTLQHGPMVAAMGARAAAAAGLPAAQPTEITKEVKSHTARSLLRMLRAGTGIKTPNNIPITEAEAIIMKLAGEFAPAEVMRKKKRNAGREALSVLLTMYLQKPITMAEAAACFDNPVNRGLEPTPYLFEILGDKTWPPVPEGRPAQLPAVTKKKPTKRAVKPRAPPPNFDGSTTHETAHARAKPAVAMASPFAVETGTMPTQPSTASPFAPPLESPFAVEAHPPVSPFEQVTTMHKRGTGYSGNSTHREAEDSSAGSEHLKLTPEEAAKIRDASLSGLLASAQIGIGSTGEGSGGNDGAKSGDSSGSANNADSSKDFSKKTDDDDLAPERGTSSMFPSLSGLGTPSFSGILGSSGFPSGLGGATLSGILGPEFSKGDFTFGKADSLIGQLPDVNAADYRSQTLSGILSFGDKDTSWQEISRAANQQSDKESKR